MKANKQNEYYDVAIKWANEYLTTNVTQIDVKHFDGHIIHDTHTTLKVWVYRLTHGANREKHASYIKIKKYKDFIIKQDEN